MSPPPFPQDGFGIKTRATIDGRANVRQFLNSRIAEGSPE